LINIGPHLSKEGVFIFRREYIVAFEWKMGPENSMQESANCKRVQIDPRSRCKKRGLPVQNKAYYGVPVHNGPFKAPYTYP
jgi:hypothetical protein